VRDVATEIDRMTGVWDTLVTGDRPFLTVRGSVSGGTESANVTENGIENVNGIENGIENVNKGKEGNVSVRQGSARHESVRHGSVRQESCESTNGFLLQVGRECLLMQLVMHGTGHQRGPGQQNLGSTWEETHPRPSGSVKSESVMLQSTFILSPPPPPPPLHIESSCPVLKLSCPHLNSSCPHSNSSHGRDV
jgi:hypothetical protein